MESLCYRCGVFSVDARNRSFKRGDSEIPLEPKALEVILQLLARPGQLVTRNELLDAVWGHRHITPSTLSRVIVLARRAFLDDLEEPQFIQTVRGAGYRYVGPVQREQSAPHTEGTQFAPPAFVRLPARIEELIGRGAELAEIAAMLGRHRAVTVLGPGGVGKTSCALEAARRCAASYPDGVWFFDLVALRSAAAWLQAVGTALSIQAAAQPELLAKVCTFFARRRALLVLDNCDQIAADVGRVAHELLRGTEGVTLLCTSQQPLRMVGEQLMRMPPLALPELSALTDDRAVLAAAAAPACELLAARARAARPGFTVTASNAGTIVDICHRLDGLPLALELAAARFALLAPEQVLARLTERFRFLSSGAAGREDRHHNLRALLDWSYGLLSPAEQQLLSWLGVFVRGWSVDAAIFVAHRLGHDSGAAVDLLGGLVDKSLVAVDDGSAPQRYRLLETIREFALERLRAANAELDARNTHLAYVRRLSEEIEGAILAGRLREQLASVVHEDGNIESALEHASRAPGDRETALAIVGSLAVYLKARGHYTAGARWCDLALGDGAESHESFAAGRALLCKGMLVLHLKTRGSAERLLSAAARVARLVGDPWGEAYAAGYRALSLVHAGDADGAAASAEVARRIAEELNDPLLRGLAGLARGWAEFALGNYRAAIDTLRAVRDVGPDAHQHHFVGVYIGLLHYTLDEYALAAEEWLHGLKRAGYFYNIRGMAASVEGAGYLALKESRPDVAAQLLGAAARMRTRTGSPLFQLWVPSHEQAERAARAALGEAYEEHTAAGEQLREETAVDRARALLQQVSASS